MDTQSSRPVVKGPLDGNAFAILGAVRRALTDVGQGDRVEEFTRRATAGDYHHLLRVAMEYVDFDLEPREHMHGMCPPKETRP